jgi:hypothetical protein
MSEIDLIGLRRLIDNVIYAPTKKEAKPSIKRLEFIASNIKGTIGPYLSGKLSEAIDYADQASGQTQNKEHWISCAEQSWHVFESRIN